MKLVRENHGRGLHPGWTLTSEFVAVAESFGTAPIHGEELGPALRSHVSSHIDVASLELSPDEKYIADNTGVTTVSAGLSDRGA